MLHLIPAPLHRAALRCAHALRKRWWRLARPRIRGCRVLAIDGEGRVLLVRHAYGSGKWLTPGGSVKRGEPPLDAALRELREETGCRLTDPVEIALSEEPFHGATNRVHVVVGRTGDRARADGREIVEAAFFALDALPADMPPVLRAALPGWITAGTAARPVSPPPPARPPATTG